MNAKRVRELLEHLGDGDDGNMHNYAADVQEAYDAMVVLLGEARDWIDAAGDFMARPIDLLNRMDAALKDKG